MYVNALELPRYLQIVTASIAGPKVSKRQTKVAEDLGISARTQQ